MSLLWTCALGRLYQGIAPKLTNSTFATYIGINWVWECEAQENFGILVSILTTLSSAITNAFLPQCCQETCAQKLRQGRAESLGEHKSSMKDLRHLHRGGPINRMPVIILSIPESVPFIIPRGGRSV